MAPTETVRGLDYQDCHPNISTPKKASDYCSLLGAEKGDSLEFPVDLGAHSGGKSIAWLLITGRVRLQVDPRDQVLIITLGVLVDGAVVVSLLYVGLGLVAATWSRSTLVLVSTLLLSSNVDNREWLEWILGGLILETFLIS